MVILGLTSHHPDASAALVVDGKVTSAAEEERFSRVKHYAGFPSASVSYCLKEAGISAGDIDYIAVPRKRSARLFRKALYALRMPELAFRRASEWKKASGIKSKISEAMEEDEKNIRAGIVEVEHHTAHLASSFFTSGFEKSFLFSVDALGDFASAMWALGEGNKIKILGEVGFPHSLGFYYTALTQYLGFTDFGDEYKVMGLASYGKPAYEDEFKKILKTRPRGFELGLEYFLHHKKYISMDFRDGSPIIDTIFSPHLEKRLGTRRFCGAPIEKRHKDIAKSLQNRLEEALTDLLDTNSPLDPNLCLAGGVAFNCAANGKLYELGRFKNIYVPPAAGDAGLAVGAALYLWNEHSGKRPGNATGNAFLGPRFDNNEIRREIERSADHIKAKGCVLDKARDEDELCGKVARYISDGKVAGWFQGRMEFGPRALGNRSILADPRRSDMKELVNRKIKHRESFRPFAPSVLEEYADRFFVSVQPSPFMSFVFKVKPEAIDAIPSVVHVDGTARPQTVTKKTNILYWKLIDEFRHLTGIPVLLNTSFNDNEPIVSTPQEAINCFLNTGMDILAAGNYIIRKK